ncbi:FAD/NAD(P)-binding protein [Umezawaea sp. Da 62-37]|uniref:FAD/NAD(P)-binding protein n=1 Tax=Umezawaea sp. Da 62-37 TaxID=3075927 RepID=UPI0028F719BD|nr:FAD/NAD(P)-binding protein [Umezawaea sp. Da 62-37]WNV90475.1 FAD/NAD(P)-binding protein [Umezawaea sp. Da 62-37]
MNAPPLVLALVGGGPRAAGLIERIAVNAPELFPGGALEIHVVDPHPVGAGRVWRYEQSALLRMNSMAADVTMFTDDSVVCDGPVRTGPSLAEWAEAVRSGGLSDVDLPADVLEELDRLLPTTFPSRRLQSAYLAWFHRDAVAALPAGITVRQHRAKVVRVTGSPRGGQRVWLADRDRPLVADVVVLSLGHLDAQIGVEEKEMLSYADEHGLAYLPPDYSADSDLSAIRAGEDVVLRGFGLAFIDLMVLLTQGRGGKFAPTPDGLRYEPSGQEPRIHVGSRRGVPYHSKTGYRLQGDPLPLPRFFDAAVADRLLDRPGTFDFKADVWPLLAKEIGWGYYHELFTGHPDRVSLPWQEFAAAYTALSWYDAEMAALVEAAVPAEEDRLDFERLDRPLAGLEFADGESLQEHLRDYVEADVARRSDAAFSADLGAFMALLSIYGQLPRVLNSPKLDPGSRLAHADGWWMGFFSYQASGPPPDRLEELLALSRAGIVRFLGADMWVRAEDGVFLAGSASAPDVVRATGLVEARLPAHGLAETADPVLAALRGAGDVVEELLSDGRSTGLVRVADDNRLIGRDGVAHPRRFALGPFTTGRAFAAFARPRTNAPGFRQNDGVARTLLRLLAAEGEGRSESVA